LKALQIAYAVIITIVGMTSYASSAHGDGFSTFHGLASQYGFKSITQHIEIDPKIATTDYTQGRLLSLSWLNEADKTSNYPKYFDLMILKPDGTSIEEHLRVINSTINLKLTPYGSGSWNFVNYQNRTNPEMSLFQGPIDLIAPILGKSGQYQISIFLEGISVGHDFTVFDDHPEFDYYLDVPVTKSMAPLQQLRSGVSANEIACPTGFFLLLKASNGSPVCIKPENAKKLLGRGWAKNHILDFYAFLNPDFSGIYYPNGTGIIPRSIYVIIHNFRNPYYIFSFQTFYSGNTLYKTDSENVTISDLHEDGSYRYNIVFNTHNDIRQEAAKVIITCNNETQAIYVPPPEPLH